MSSYRSDSYRSGSDSYGRSDSYRSDSYRSGGSRPDSQTKIYVGDLARDTTEKDLDHAFSYYGQLRSTWVARNPAGFGFVVFEDARDAKDAVKGLDGSSICGARVRVEHASDRPKSRFRGGGGGFRGGRGGGGRRPFNPDNKCYQCGEPGHYAYDCRNASSSRGYDRGGQRSSKYDRSRSRSRSRSNKRSYSRSRSPSPPRRKQRSESKSHSRSPGKNGHD